VRTYVWAIICFTLSLLAKTSVVMLPFILLLLAWWRYKDLEPLRKSYDLEENPTESGILLWSCVAAGAMVGGVAVLLNPWLGLVAAFVVGGAGYAAGQQVRKLKIWNRFAGFEVIRSIPFFLVAALLGAVTIYFQYGRAIGGEEIPIGALWQRAISACFATGFYLYSALWPFNIIEIYPQWHRAFSLLVTEPKPHWDSPAPEALAYWKQILPGLAIGGLLAYCWTRRAQAASRALLVGLACYILAMLPALGLLKMSYMRLTLVADHFQYISIVAVIALVVAGGYTRALKPLWLAVAAVFFAVVTWLNWGQTADNHLWEVIWLLGVAVLALAAAQGEEFWKYAWGGFLIAVLLCAAVVSFQQSKIYHSEKTLWTATLEKNPNTWQGHNHLGAALYMEGDVKDAYPHFLRATQLKPENPESHNNLGLALSYYHQMDEAVHQYEIAVGIKDDSAMDTNLANAYEQVGRYDDAVKTYRHAIELNPTNASAHCNLGYALMQQGKIDEAIPEFMLTIQQDPGMPQGRADLTQALKMKGIDPNNPDPATLRGEYPFDAEKAVMMLHGGPQPPPGQ
jgi:tetratricopeptide (TPR) repeat protein